MVQQTKVPKDCISAEMAWKMILYGIEDIYYLSVPPNTCVEMQAQKDHCEVWVRVSDMTAYVCVGGEQYALKNDSDETVEFLLLKCESDSLYTDIVNMFKLSGFSVYQCSQKN